MEENSLDLDELRKEFQQEKKEVATLHPQLNQLNSGKESIFRELRSLRDKIKFRASKIQMLKKERDELTKKVKELKGEREKLNQEVKDRAGERRGISQKKKELLDQLHIKDDPVKIKLMIEKLESKIETEVMPFTKEQQLQKKIKELKAQFKELEKLGETWKDISSASASFFEIKQKAEEFHYNVQTLAKQSQGKHEEINRLYEELKTFRSQEQLLAEKYLQLKVKFEQIKKELEEKLARLNKISKVLREEEENDFNFKVREKTAEVREKLKNRKKLSTEDILAFQASREKE
ncbi:hypothetical protein HZC32_00395 [Candidatus Woesearchaeota archaeon]|nr:hypothetical protein [Candidatus Woesearchaeota archaeon]